MNEKSHQNVPDQRIGEEEVDKLIAHFGIRPSPEKREELLKALEDQKAIFLAGERHREGTSHDHQRGR